MKAGIGLAALAALGAIATAPALGGLVVVQNTVIDAPGVRQVLQQVPELQREPLLADLSPMLMGTPWVSTTYLDGAKMRSDMGKVSVVSNAADGREFTLNRLTKRYSIGAYDPFQSAAGSFTFHVTPTSQTKTMLGYTIRRYLIAMTSSVLPQAQISGDMWSAPSLPTPPMLRYRSGPAAAIANQMAKVRGMPLAYRIIYSNTPEGTITVTSWATMVKQETLPTDAFMIPTGFTEGATRTSTGMPSAGFPLGDGMPLDTISSVTDSMIGGDASAAGANSSALQGLLGGAGGQGLGGADASNIHITPQMMQAITSQLQQMLGGAQ